MDKCPKCGADAYGFIEASGAGIYKCGSTDQGFDPEHPAPFVSVDCLSRQLAAANERAGRLQAQMVELQKAWDILRHDDFVVNGGDRVNWNAHDEAKANIDRILGGA